MILKYFGFIFLLSSSVLKGQTDPGSELFFYADAMVNASDAGNREHAGNEFSEKFEKWISQPGTFTQSLDNIKWISTKSPIDKSFRLITWQVKGVNDKFLHKGLIQKKDGTIIQLQDEMPKDMDAQYEVADADNWYGALYYGIEKVDDYYLLFGFNGGSGREYTKLVDVLWFDKNGQPKFGKEVFRFDTNNPRPDMKSRILVGYTPTASVSCRYDEESKMIMHDYTVDRLLGMEGNQSGKIPDGTYVAYQLENHIWQRIEKLENTQVELKSPDYNSKRDNSRSDILGRPAKSKN